MTTIDIDIDDIEGLREELKDHARCIVANAQAADRAVLEIRDELRKVRFEQERLRFMLYRVAPLKHSDIEICVVCGRSLPLYTSSRQPRLCHEHLLKEYGCPECIKDSRSHAMTWSPQKHRATCRRCKTSFTGRQMEKRIYDYWCRRYED